MSLVDRIEAAREERYVGNVESLKNLISLAEDAIVDFCSKTELRKGYMPWHYLNSNDFDRAFREASAPARKLLFKHLINQGISIRVLTTSNGYFFEFLPPVVPDIYKDGVSMFEQSPDQI